MASPRRNPRPPAPPIGSLWAGRRSAPEPLDSSSSSSDSDEEDYTTEPDTPTLASVSNPIPPSTNMSGAAAAAAAAVAARPTELRIATLTFDGARDQSTRWLLSTIAYLDINAAIYNTDTAKIIFALSLMKEGPAAVWAEELLGHAQIIVNGARTGYGTWAAFMTAFRDNFDPIDQAGSSLTKLMNLRQEPDQLTEYIAEFKQLSYKAGITEDVAKIQFFLDGLPMKLLYAYHNTATALPTAFDAVVTRVVILEGQRLRMKGMNERLFKKKGQEPKKKSYGSSRYTPNYKTDPNAMDVDRLSNEERTDHMKKGLCFNCSKSGHRSHACPTKKTGDARKTSKGKKPVRQLPEDEESSNDDEERFETVEDEEQGGEVKQMKDF